MPPVRLRQEEHFGRLKHRLRLKCGHKNNFRAKHLMTKFASLGPVRTRRHRNYSPCFRNRSFSWLFFNIYSTNEWTQILRETCLYSEHVTNQQFRCIDVSIRLLTSDTPLQSWRGQLAESLIWDTLLHHVVIVRNAESQMILCHWHACSPPSRWQMEA